MADNNTILEKLEGLVARFEEVSTLITEALRKTHQRVQRTGRPDGGP